MPIYEYVCQSCDHRFEVKQRFSDEPVSSCVRCGQAVTKVISAPAIMFKGSGWYVTDYSEKLKAPGQPDATQTPANEQGDQKSSTTSSTDSIASPSRGAPGSESTGPSKPTPASPSTTPPSSSSTPSPTPSSGKASD